MTPDEAVPCPSCSTATRPYDTEPWPEKNELTYAFECRCGNVWTEDRDHLARASKRAEHGDD